MKKMSLIIKNGCYLYLLFTERYIILILITKYYFKKCHDFPSFPLDNIPSVEGKLHSCDSKQ